MIRTTLLACALLACQSSSTSTPPAPSTAPSAATQAKGRVEHKRFASEALGVEKDVVVYTPVGYDSGKRYPVLYYLHGLGGSEEDWVGGGHIAEVADKLRLPAIIVMPDGDNHFYADAATPTDYDACMRDGTGLFDPRAPRAKTCVRTPSYERYITRDLIAWVDQTYRTITTREGRGIAGLSMGGFGALQLSMRHPELYAAAASHSGVDALLYAGPFPYEAGKVVLETDANNWGRMLGPFGAWIRGVFGTDIERWRSYDPAVLAQKLTPGTLALYLDCGTEDEFALHNGAQYLHDTLTARGIEHAWYLGPGHHDFTFWSQRVPESLAFLSQKVAKPQ